MQHPTIPTFIEWLSQQAGIRLELMNNQLIEAVFRKYYYGGVGTYVYRRGSGATTTLMAWAKWMDTEIVAVSRHPEMWRAAGVMTLPWGFMPPDYYGIGPDAFVVIDDPLSAFEKRSLSRADRFAAWRKRLRLNSFYVVGSELGDGFLERSTISHEQSTDTDHASR